MAAASRSGEPGADRRRPPMTGQLGIQAVKAARADNRLTESDSAGADSARGEMQWSERPWDLVDWEAEERLGWWTRMWRAKWNLKPRGPLWLPEIIRMTWFLFVCQTVLMIHGGIDGQMGGPFFYSRTSCCGQSGTPKVLPAKFDVHYPKTCIDYGICQANLSHVTIKACEVPMPPLGRNDPAWSHSPYCPNCAPNPPCRAA